MQARAKQPLQPLPLGFLLVYAMVFAMAVAGTVHACRTMPMMWSPMPCCSWIVSAEMFLLVWSVMMVAMMLPSALPMLLSVRSNSDGKFGIVAAFAAAGYFFVWTFIGAIVYVYGTAYALEAARLAWLSRLTPVLSGIALIFTGVVQFSPLKMAALRRCRAMRCNSLLHAGVIGGWRYGLRQGMACGICCAAPMFALLVLGMMNSVAMIVITVVITAEKLLPHPERIARAFGFIAVLAGMGMAARALLLQGI